MFLCLISLHSGILSSVSTSGGDVHVFVCGAAELHEAQSDIRDTNCCVTVRIQIKVTGCDVCICAAGQNITVLIIPIMHGVIDQARLSAGCGSRPPASRS